MYNSGAIPGLQGNCWPAKGKCRLGAGEISPKEVFGTKFVLHSFAGSTGKSIIVNYAVMTWKGLQREKTIMSSCHAVD